MKRDFSAKKSPLRAANSQGVPWPVCSSETGASTQGGSDVKVGRVTSVKMEMPSFPSSRARAMARL
jgi:hypothetical protein